VKSLFISIAISTAYVIGTGCTRTTIQKNAEFDHMFDELKQMVLKGQIEEAIPLFREAAAEARARSLPNYEVKFLSDLGNCQFAMYQFQAAVITMQESRDLAKRTDNRRYVAKIDSNISSLYSQLGNLDQAARAAEEALAFEDGLNSDRDLLALLHSQLGVIRGQQGLLKEGEYEFRKAIEIAHEAGKFNAEASAWDNLAYARLMAGRLQTAADAVNHSIELRRRSDVGGIDGSLMIMGMVRGAEGDLRSALALLNQAEIALGQPGSLTPPWWIYLRRGEVQMQSGDFKAALTDFRKALMSAREWRVDVPPSDVNRTSSEAKLADLYQALVEAGNQLYLKTHEPALIRETFEAAEENRAASLRALLPQESDWRKKLPTHYYELLHNLQAEQAHQLRLGESHPSLALLDLRSQLAQIEAEVGGERRHRQTNAIDQAQGMLDATSVLFSFALGDDKSWMWAVTKDGITLHCLPSKSELSVRIANFERAVSSNSDEAARQGSDLFRSLFGSLGPAVVGHKRWLVSLDGPLFDLPFPALSATAGRFLIEDHSIQIATGALMLRSGGYVAQVSRQRGGFLAVGDPIYNLADPRAQTKHGPPLWPGILRPASDDRGPTFARLWGTAKEIKVAANAWNAQETVLLTGKQVSPETFWNQTLSKPEIIHIATHVLEESDKPRTGWIAFSLGSRGQIQYVTPEDILAKSVSAQLVVLSGCSSGKADIQPATGLMGLTRAWIAAGAGSVLATRWPTVDDDGAFFESFYRNLRQLDKIDPSEALRLASIEMLKSGTWRAHPSFWAGYFLIGNY
jgi:CHAT domain-containing protein